MRILSITRQGLTREQNEDRALVKRFDNGAVLLAVADGMGGHAAGEVAARIAVDTLNDFDSLSSAIETHLIELVLAARRKVFEASEADRSLYGMGTTLTAAFVADAVVHWIHVGDSRLYLFREGVLAQMTDDHTFVGVLLREGKIPREAARVHPLQNSLMNCIGCNHLEVDTGSFGLNAGDLLLLSTDGLHDKVPEEDIEAILRTRMNLKNKLEALTRAAIAGDGRDDITAVAMEI